MRETASTLPRTKRTNLALVEEGALPGPVHANAGAKIARHTAALQPIAEVNRYGPPPDFKGQPV